ncbi:uncharacterized protein RCC_03133 [Ramularia collo-cygni]|uniref:SWI5-dependent HO expression protein 3 n=1 Tax=Ramularia collo-cygni TaxID=112498 RepID=A0A2D3V730_9PEZI|nr:uncharacterized protein RCC_03133 [Ramularia collo-cygni]CZT17299.1 uncharacterized protein RCC_03133 [Ramularia collo-cygni]
MTMASKLRMKRPNSISHTIRLDTFTDSDTFFSLAGEFAARASLQHLPPLPQPQPPATPPTKTDEDSPPPLYSAGQLLPEVAMSGYHFSNNSSPNGKAENSATTPSNILLTPVPNGTRRTSGDVSSLSRPPNSENAPPSPVSDSGGSLPWSSAVGHATTGGKSGRVIEKLMTDNDRLKRELKEQIIKGEELQRSLQVTKPRIDALQAENDNLTHARGVDNALLARRDRMIAELKADLQTERKRREGFESRSQALETERDEAVEEKRRELQNLMESEKHATTHAAILETSHKQLSTTYKTRLESTRKEVAALKQHREEQEARLERLDVVSEQMRQELERAKKVQAEMLGKWGELKDALTARMQSAEMESKEEAERTRKLSTEMDTVVKQMKWAMGLGRARGLNGDHEEPGSLGPGAGAGTAESQNPSTAQI